MIMDNELGKMLFGELYLKNKGFEGIEYLIAIKYFKRSLILH